ncbi:MAG: hypothetical protein AAFQ13_03100 [Pseudomonadota bacterium]
MTQAVFTGSLTAVLTPYVLSLVSVLTGFNPYGLTLALFVPIGAMACGFAAVSGFYFVAIQSESIERPPPVLLAAMLVAACLSVSLLYLFQYLGAFLPGYSLLGVVSFGDYLSFAFSNASLVTRYGRTFENESGDLIVAMSWAKLVGFLLAAALTYKQIPSSRGFSEDW